MDQDQARREVAAMMLEALEGTDFVLTGASALSEHGVIQRPTRDVDLFTVGQDGGQIHEALTRLRDAFAARGAGFEVGRDLPGFADGSVTWGGHEIGFDLGSDWRAYPAVHLEIGPVLDIRDSVASKTAALYSRGESRDYMDVAAIVRDGRWTLEEIMSMAGDNDPGFDRDEFARVLDPAGPRFPASQDFRDMGFNARDEDMMRTALTALRGAAHGEDVRLEDFDAVRIARAGSAQPLRAQLRSGEHTAQRPRSHESGRPGPEVGHER